MSNHIYMSLYDHLVLVAEKKDERKQTGHNAFYETHSIPFTIHAPFLPLSTKPV